MFIQQAPLATSTAWKERPSYTGFSVVEHSLGTRRVGNDGHRWQIDLAKSRTLPIAAVNSCRFQYVYRQALRIPGDQRLVDTLIICEERKLHCQWLVSDDPKELGADLTVLGHLTAYVRISGRL